MTATITLQVPISVDFVIFAFAKLFIISVPKITMC